MSRRTYFIVRVGTWDAWCSSSRTAAWMARRYAKMGAVVVTPDDRVWKPMGTSWQLQIDGFRF